MMSLPGYQVFEKVYESSRSLIYRAQRNSDQEPVLLKVLRQEYPSPAAIARFQMEYDILRSLDLTGVIRAYALETNQQSPVLVLEDFGGESLQTWLGDRTLSLEEFLTVAIQITSILGEIHQHNLIHKDINPSNIVLNPATGQIKIIDFGIASKLSRETPTHRNPDILEGTLAYMSPEQTGRMNRAMDYRTDFYSLGVIFYQLLCSRLPFEATDALELVHYHIARQPIPPHQLSNAQYQPSSVRTGEASGLESPTVHVTSIIPRVVSDVVIKLLAKNAEDRYQSAYGICADLRECLNQLQQTENIESFPVGRWDISSTFQIPQKLYGREQEVAALLAAFHRVTRQSFGVMNCDDLLQTTSGAEHLTQDKKHTELVLVSGSPGIGKTTLVQELYKPMTRQRGYLITGKYELLQRNVPYRALIQAFRELIRHLLSESEAQLAGWRSRLLAALGENAQIVVDVIPDLELIIGKQPSAIKLPPMEAENRFHLMLEKFIDVFTRPTNVDGMDPPYPLVIFLDDLQWADSASLQLVQRWLTVSTDQPLLVIGAYRDHEVDVLQILRRSLNDMQQAGSTIHHIALLPLGLADINHLIQDTFQCSTEAALPLAALTLQKTEGNPFFINEFLRALHQDNLIYFNAQQCIWQWDLQSIQTANLTSNVVELVGDRIQSLPVMSQQVLSLAACMGNRFELRALSVIHEQSLLELATHLKIAVQENLIIPIGEDHNYLEFYPQSTEIDLDISYRFLHDHIQQTVYSLIPEHTITHYHLKIGRFLLKTAPRDLLEDKIFDIVDHLNLSLELITDQEQRNQVAQLNHMASQKAIAAIAYNSSFNYLKIGLSLLANNSWQTAYGLTLALCESTAKAAYLAGDYETMEECVAEVQRHAQTAIETTQVSLVKIQACIAQDRFLDAIQFALQVLDLLGVKLPAQPDSASIAQGLSETKRMVAENELENLAQLPKMTDPQQLAAMQIIASVCTPTYFLAPELWKLMVFQKMQLSVQYGNAPGSAFGYADYGMIQCAVEDNIDAAYQFAELAINLQSQLNAKEFIPKTALLVNMYLKHWREHLKETLHPLLEAYRCGLETGDLEYATFAIAFRFYHSFLVGRELTQLEQEMASYEGAIAQFKQVLPLTLTRIYRQSVLNLIEHFEQPACLVGRCYDENASLPQLIAENDNYSLFHLYLIKLILAYLFQDMRQAEECSETAARLLSEGAVGLLIAPVFYFYNSLAKLAIFSEASSIKQQHILKTVEAHQQKMKQWADHAPMNYLHKFHLVEAERYRILGQDSAAIEAYDSAIDLAQTHEYLNEEALANELAGRFYLTKDKPKIARAYLLDAHHCYLRWGATAKVDHLDLSYPQFFDRLSDRTSTLNCSQHNSLTTSSSTVTVALDLAALMKASQTLSEEIVLDKLLAKLMSILIENAGAQRGCLILEQDGQLQIEVESHVESNSISLLNAIPLTSETGKNRVPLAIVHYVARTQESVVLSHVTQDYRFNQDAYILAYKPKSILCTPLLYQGKLSGIAYLENNLTVDVFTPKCLKILQFLSTQAAISIDNARLYNQLETRVQERTVELTQTNDRLQAEIIERQRSEQTLRMIVEGTASVTGVDFFRSLVRSLAQALNVRYAFISECVDAIPTRVRSFAFWQGSEFGDEFEYDLQGTPCERIIDSKSCLCFPEQIQSIFPDDQDLKTMQAQSYAGIALLDSTGTLLGHLAILDDRPLDNETRTQAVLEIFAARAAAEMERKQAEDALRVSETKFSTAFRSSPDAITISTLKDGCYIEVNESCLQMLGYCREEMIGRSALELGVWAKAAERDTIQQRLHQQKSVTNLEITLCRKSGESFPALFSAEVIHLEDEPCLLSVAADITMLKQAEKALARLAEIGELAAMIVHEVRNPLTTISMGLNAFKKLQLSERFQEYLSLSLDEADRLQRLLNQILLYSKPQSLQRSHLELNSLIADSLDRLRVIPAALEKPLKLIAPTEPVTVLGDRDKLKQVLINLITNACEAVSAGDAITVQLQRTDNRCICLQIHNGGAPIPADILPNLTKPFFTTKASGTGLGLAIVKRIIEAHDGEFKIESSEITGTIVTVQLPIAHE